MLSALRDDVPAALRDNIAPTLGHDVPGACRHDLASAVLNEDGAVLQDNDVNAPDRGLERSRVEILDVVAGNGAVGIRAKAAQPGAKDLRESRSPGGALNP